VVEQYLKGCGFVRKACNKLIKSSRSFIREK
jgi:hypothetical protein